MPKVAADNSPLLERAIFGYDGTSYRVVKVDADGNLVAALKATQSIEVTQDTAADLLATVDIAAGQSVGVTQDDDTLLKATVALKADQNVQARSHGWIGAAWQKQPLLLGYSANVAQRTTNTNLSAGAITLAGAAVPAGEIWVITNVAGMYAGTVPTLLRFQVVIGGTVITLFEQQPVVSNRYYAQQGYWVLAEGDYVRVYIESATAGDDAFLEICGLRVDIDQ